MPRSKRQPISSFSLSFLDIMFCGFGAVVLLVLIINSRTMARIDLETAGQSRSLEQQRMAVRAARAGLETLEREQDRQLAAVENLGRTRAELLSATAEAAERQRVETTEPEPEIEELQAEVRALERTRRDLLAERAAARRAGRTVRPFENEGHRQYLTGLKLGGKRVLILLDSSASMLDTKIVDIVRRKVLGEELRRSAPKWRRAVASVAWLLANFPPDSSVRLCHFSERPAELSGAGAPGWLPVTDSAGVDSLLAALDSLAPLGSTNLEAAFDYAGSLVPRPDNIILITDGLPTRGSGTGRAPTVSGAERVRLFLAARKKLPPGLPVNVILLPLEGDPLAAVHHWELALDSGGSFFTPARDWP